jgi:Tol biopolymer transport system component
MGVLTRTRSLALLMAFAIAGGPARTTTAQRAGGAGSTPQGSPQAGSAGAVTFQQDVSWSPDGRQVAFSANHDGQWNVYVADATTGGVRPLTHGPSANVWTAWSPDGRRLAYTSAPKGQPSDIYVTDAVAGTATTRLTVQNGQRSSQPAWSPDGRTIAFVSKQGSAHQQIWLMDADGAHARALTRLDLDADCPQWSHDGTRLVFYVNTGPSRDEIWTIDADGRAARSVIHDEANNIYASWTREDDIVWSRQVGGATSVMRARADGSGASVMVPQAAFFARVSLDGQSVALIAGKYPSTTLQICDIHGEHCRVIDPPRGTSGAGRR